LLRLPPLVKNGKHSGLNRVTRCWCERIAQNRPKLPKM
jgi:hypothetical protein